MADVTVTYNGQNILEMSATGRKTLKTAKKRCKTDIEVAYVKSGGATYQSKTVTPGASQQVVLPDAGYDALSQVTVNGDADLIPGNIKQGIDIFGVVGTYDGSMPEPALPAAYQRVEYLDFVPNVGILVTIPTTGHILFSADCSSIKNKTSSEQYSCVFGYRKSSTSQKDFMLDFTGTSSKIHGFIRSASNGYVLEAGEAYVSGERVTIHILLKEPRSTALIGCYLDDAPNSYSATTTDSFHGPFYSLKGNDPVTGEVVAWFVPCYRKSDNQVGVYDYLANAFYAETRHYGSDYSITAGPDVN